MRLLNSVKSQHLQRERIDNKNNTCFSAEQMYGRANVSKEEVENILRLYTPRLLRAVNVAFDNYLKLLEDRPQNKISRNWKPTELNAQVQGELDNEFPDALKTNDNDKKYLELDGLKIYFKLCDEDKCPKSILSKAVKMEKEQMCRQPNGLPILFLLYETDKSRTILNGIYIKYIKGSESWIYDLELVPVSSTCLKSEFSNYDQERKSLVSVKRENINTAE